MSGMGVPPNCSRHTQCPNICGHCRSARTEDSWQVPISPRASTSSTAPPARPACFARSTPLAPSILSSGSHPTAPGSQSASGPSEAEPARSRSGTLPQDDGWQTFPAVPMHPIGRNLPATDSCCSLRAARARGCGDCPPASATSKRTGSRTATKTRHGRWPFRLMAARLPRAAMTPSPTRRSSFGTSRRDA